MKKYILLFMMTAVILACNETTENENEGDKEIDTLAQNDAIVTEDDDPAGMYGEDISAEGAMDPETFMSEMGEKDSMEAKVSGTATAICQMKGCWMRMAMPGNEEMRISFREYGFFVPKNAADRQVIIEGTAYRTETSVEELKHFAEDEGLSEEEIEAITEPEKAITFVADGVIIK